MGLLRDIRTAVFGRKITRIEDIFGGVLSGLTVDQLRDYESYLRASSKKVWASWKSIDLKAQACAETKIAFMSGKTEAAQKPVEAPKELAALMDRPNDHETFHDIIYKTVFHIAATGNAYWYKNEATVTGERPRSIMLLNPKRVKIVCDDRRGLTGYIYKTNGKDVPLQPQEIIHFKKPHPNNDWYGLGELEAAETLFQENLDRQAWSRNFWKHGASPSGVLVMKERVESQTEFDKLKARWDEQYSGVNNAGKTAILTGDWSYQQLGLTAQEMQDIERSKFNVESIACVHGVPLSVLGVKDAANYATAEIDGVRFRTTAVRPILKLLEAVLNSKFMPGYGQNIRLQFCLSGLVNTGAMMELIKAGFDRGIFTPNQCLAMLGEPTVDEDPLMDSRFISSMYVPMEIAGAASLDKAEAAGRALVEKQLHSLIHGDKPKGD